MLPLPFRAFEKSLTMKNILKSFREFGFYDLFVSKVKNEYEERAFEASKGYFCSKLDLLHKQNISAGWIVSDDPIFDPLAIITPLKYCLNFSVCRALLRVRMII